MLRKIDDRCRRADAQKELQAEAASSSRIAAVTLSANSGGMPTPASGGQKILVSADPDSIGPKESSDGQEVYFAERELNALLRKVSLGQPNSELLAKGLPRVSNWTLWTIAAGGIYFVPADTPKSLCYFDFTTKQIREVFKVEKNFDNGLSVSPDGRWLLYSQVDEENSDIMLVDHFS